jgi:hypothetical protein
MTLAHGGCTSFDVAEGLAVIDIEFKSRLVSIDLPLLKKTFKENGVNGAVLLELNERMIMRDLLITNEANVKRS